MRVRWNAISAMICLVLLFSVSQLQAFEIDPEAKKMAFTRAYDSRYTFKGITDKYIRNITEHWLLPLEKRNPAILTMFAAENKPNNAGLLPWSGEFAGKYLTAASEIYALTRDPELKKTIEDFVPRLLSYQELNGYLGPWPKEYELTNINPGGGNTWDSWNHYHIMTGLLKWYEVSQDTNALVGAQKIADLFYEKFYQNLDELIRSDRLGWGNGNMEFHLTAADSIAKLYTITPDPKYLSFAKFIVHEGFPRAGDYYHLGLSSKHFCNAQTPDATRWERLHAIMAMSKLYRITGEESYIRSFGRLWWSITELDCHNTLGFSTNESAQGNSYGFGSIETCCSIAFNAMSVEMLKSKGCSTTADIIEMIHLNSLRASQDISGKWSTYHTGTEGKRISNIEEIGWQGRPGSEELNCCSVNAARGFGLLSEWALMRYKEGIALNWYGPCTIETSVDNIPVSLVQKTEYPRTGVINLEINPARAHTFGLKLRIPFWSDKTKITVNTEETHYPKASEYFELMRQWKPGDHVKVELTMNMHYWAGEREETGNAAFYYGPVLLAENPDHVPSLDVKMNSWYKTGPCYNSNTVGGTLTITTDSDVLYLYCDHYADGGMLDVSIDGKFREKVDLYGPGWGTPNMKTYALDGKKTHTVTVTFLEEVNPKSNGRYGRIRIRTVQPSTIDVNNVNFTLGPDKNNGTIQVFCNDTNGKQVVLTDFDSAGWDDKFYFSWLGVENAKKRQFSKQNPVGSVILR